MHDYSLVNWMMIWQLLIVHAQWSMIYGCGIQALKPLKLKQKGIN